jgi:gliding motility-associated lipoprotein GldK
MHNDYFWHEAYSDYPVVGITWQQAKAFCQWRTLKKNIYRKERKKEFVNSFRLPSEAEWEYAARGGLEGATFPWGGPYAKNDRGCFLANFKPLRGNYAADQALYTVEADAYEPNEYNLFNMAGNVSEWTSSTYERDSYEFSSSINPSVSDNENNEDGLKVVRGGSWKDVSYYLQVSTRDFEKANVPRSYIGFRTVQDYLGTDVTANAATN